LVDVVEIETGEREEELEEEEKQSKQSISVLNPKPPAQPRVFVKSFSQQVTGPNLSSGAVGRIQPYLSRR
jgi:hypothetical protein